MLKNIKNIILIAGALFLCASCEDYLKSAPVGNLSPDGFYNSPAHAEQGVLGVYSILRDIEANQYMIFSNDRSDDKFVNPRIDGIRTCSEVAFLRFNYTTAEVENLWATWYSLIFNANTVLENLDACNINDDAFKNQLKGELLFLRGWAHMELARTYGSVPIVDKVISSADARERKQSAPEEVMAAAIGDLTEAEGLLPYQDALQNSEGAKIGACGRADKIAVEAMLARAYMTLKGFPFNDASAKANAKAYLEKVLNYSKANGNKYWAPTFQEWGRMFLTDNVAANKYEIFAIQHTKNSANPLAYIEGVDFAGADENGRPYLPYGGGGHGMSAAWIDISMAYEYRKENDPRGLGFSFLDTYYPWGQILNPYVNERLTVEYDGTTITESRNSIPTKWSAYQIKREAFGITDYDDQKDGTSWPINFPVLRLEDMQLLYAELLIEDGKIADAMSYVNAIRNRASITPVPTNCSAAEALNYVKRERRLELFLEGVRWFDEVRYGEWEAKTSEKFHRHDNDASATGGISFENIKEGRHFLPIPFAEMQAVPGLYVQNKGW